MFGISDNDDAKQDASSETAPAGNSASPGTTSPPPVDQTPVSDSVATPTMVQPTGDSSATTPPPFAVPADTPQPGPLAQPVGPEAIPSPIADQSALATQASDAVMPGASGIGSVHSEGSFIPTSPVADGKKAKSDDKPSAASQIAGGPQADDLLKLKQEALHSLAPLVDQLDQSPDEKFKTTMMLIQASDNAELVHEAYEAANKIPDEKARAQALLDVVNEINYFTQPHES